MKRTFKKWMTYKLMRMFVRSKRSFKKAMRTIDPSTRKKLNDLQKPLYDICIKLIGDPSTQLRANSIDYVYHIESDKYLIIIKVLMFYQKIISRTHLINLNIRF